MLAAGLALAAATFLLLSRDAEKSRESGVRVTLLRLRGTPRLCGIEQGRRLAREIRARLDRLLPSDPGLYRFQVETCGERMAAHLPPESRQELEGIAEGAGVKFLEILFLHTRTEIEAFRSGPQACGRAYAGADEAGREMPPGEPDWVVLLYEGVDPTAVVTLPGMAGGLLGGRGELLVAANSVRTEVTPVLNGLTFPLLVRRLLEAPPSPGRTLGARPTLYGSIAVGRRAGASGVLQTGTEGATWYAAPGVAEAGEGAVVGEGLGITLASGGIRPAAAAGGPLARLRRTAEGLELLAPDAAPLPIRFRPE